MITKSPKTTESWFLLHKEVLKTTLFALENTNGTEAQGDLEKDDLPQLTQEAMDPHFLASVLTVQHLNYFQLK